MLYRCLNPKCADRPDGKPGHDFDAKLDKGRPVPVCDKCGLDGRLPKFMRYIVKLVCIHFDPPSGLPGVGLNVCLCDGRDVGKLKAGEAGATGDPECVTCPKCLEHPQFTYEVDAALMVPEWKVGGMLKELEG
jgi:hypothetical protein